MRIAYVRQGSGSVVAIDQGDGWRGLDQVVATDGPAFIESLASGEFQLGGRLDVGIEAAQIFGPPVARPGKVIAVGLNYRDHIRETGATAPERPILFAKFPSSITGPYDQVVVEPDLTEQADYEVELAVVIGQRCRRVRREEALNHVFGYLVANDVSAREWQKRDVQLSRSKSMDTFCPLGPWITTADEASDPNKLWIRSWVNGEARQDSTTAEMLFKVDELIEFCSSTMTLEPGDVLLTGTPHGVGFAMEPPRFLQAGDVVRCEIEGLGHIENQIVSSR